MARKVEIVTATEEHAYAIAASVRPEDEAELWATLFSKPIDTMLKGLRRSSIAQTGIVDGVPVCMWGVVDESFVCSVGIPWMVASAKLDDVARTFLRYCRGPVRALGEEFDVLENYVDARNVRAIDWLKWCGFKVSDTPVPYGVAQLPFHKFTMRGGKSCAN